VAQYFPPDLGGSATRAYNVAKGLVLNGCNVIVLSAFPHYPHGKIPMDYRWKPFKVEWVGRIMVIRTFIFPLESRGLLRRVILFGSFVASSLFAMPLVRKVDVIWAANPDIISMIPAMVYGNLKRRPVASNVDDLSVEDLYDLKLVRKGSMISRIIELIARFSYRRAKLVTPISPGYVGIISKYGVERNRIRVVRGGVELTVFKPSASKLNVDNKFTVLYSGAFSVAYNFEQVLEAARLVEEKDHEVRFIFQGKGELANDIKSKIEKLNLDNARVVDVLLSREEVAGLLNQADVLVLPLGDFGKPHLGISAKLYEYQALGKPIICCSSGTPGNYVSETKSGIVVKPGDYKALAESVLFLKENQTVAKELGENGRRYVENNVSIDRIGLEMKRLFEEMGKGLARQWKSN